MIHPVSNRTYRLYLALVTSATLCTNAAWAQDPDPWFGRDKALHFGASATIAAGGYGVGTLVFDTRYGALALGGGLALGAGIGKEALDAAGYGDPSWRDLAWDAVGTAVGLGVAWSLDLLIRGTDSGVKGGGDARGSVVMIRF